MRLFRSVGVTTVVLMIAAPVAVALTSSGSAAASVRHAAKSRVAAHADFDGDGKSDIVAGAPGGDRVRVIYTKAKPGGSHAQWISKPVHDAFGFGSALAVGDFNGDGFADLAVGAPGFVDGDGTEQGAVFIYVGSKTGLHYHGLVFKGPDEPDNDNEFGSSLSAGAVNADRFADLAVGNPGPAGGGDSNGSVRLLFGSTSGLSTAGSVGMGSLKPVENGDFGTTVVLADVNGDGQKDLVVGEPGGGPTLPSSTVTAGDIQVFYATRTGLGTKHKMLLGSTLGAAGALGQSLAAGDVNHDGFADVVAGAPAATVSGKVLAGKVVVLAGGKHGLLASHRRVLSEATPHVPGSVVSTDRFGASVNIGDLNADGRAEVIVGAPGAVAAGQPAGGAVYLFRGTKSGVTSLHCRRITQASTGVPGNAVSGAQFGQALTTIGPAANAHRHLLVGVPDKHKGGLIVELRGGPTGVTGKHAGVLADASVGDQFGTVFAA